MNKLKVLVVSPGAQPEIPQMAIALEKKHIEFLLLTTGILGRNLDSRFFNTVSHYPKVAMLLRKRQKDIGEQHILRKFFFFEILIYMSRGYLRSLLIEFRNWVLALYSRKIIRKYKPEILIAQGHCHFLTLKYASQQNVRTILNTSIAHHEWLLNQMQMEATKNPYWSKYLQHHKFKRRIYRNLDCEMRYADRLICGSSFAATTHIEHGVNKEKIAVIPYGYNREVFYFDDLQVNTREHVLYIGQLTQRKGLGYLLEGFSQSNLGNEIYLNVVGRDICKMRSEIERFANVNYFESVDQRELRNLMSSSKVLVLPTLGEGMCLSGLEAMASGVTILTTEFAGLDDYLISGFSGIVLEDITAHEIAIKLNYIYGKSFNNKLMAKRGHLSVRNLTWENYHENFVKFIEKESKFLS